MIKTVFFDLDGTLLPMDMIVFVKAYMEELVKAMEPHGYDPDKLGKVVWDGTLAMMKNDGKVTNETLFWNIFTDVFGEDCLKDLPLFNDFYRNEFQKVAGVCGFNPKAGETIRKIHSMGLNTVLATNPVFPALATESRVRWAGMNPEDFLMITTYENSRICKPNPVYYTDILDALKLDPAECLMVGNDVDEDMAAGETGMQVFLLTDCLINRHNKDINKYPHGSFEELLEFIQINK